MIDLYFPSVGLRIPGQFQNFEDSLYENLFPENPFTGNLISYAYRDDYLKKWNKDLDRAKAYTKKKGLKNFGDCGAYSFVNLKTPPISVQTIIDFYCEYGVAEGASLDHIISGYDKSYDSFFDGIPSPLDYQDRLDITLANAELFLKECKAQGVDFLPVGSVQGWSPSTYKRCVESYKKMGYKKIAIGGIAHSPTKTIVEITSHVREVVGDMSVHLFGITTPSRIRKFNLPQITSVDGMGPYFNSVNSGMYFFGGKTYWACSVDTQREEDFSRWAEEDRTEDLRTLIEQSNGTESVPKSYFEETEELLVDTKFGLDGFSIALKDKPWRLCPCGVCRKFGAKVFIFKSPYAQLRAHHNYFEYYKLLQSAP